MTTDPLLRFRGEFPILVREAGIAAIREKSLRLDYRPGVGIRMSPHFDTTDAELETAFEVIDEIRSSSAWERWRGRPVLVT